MANNNGGGEDKVPSLNVLAQYTKDFSFENPNSPRSLQPPAQPPQIAIQINVNAKPMSDSEFEVELLIEGKAEAGDQLLFRIDLNYAGIFRVQNIPADQVHPVVLIECPRLLFPFAREIVGNAVRGGGFPPLLIDPVDFAALYRQRAAEAQAAQAPQA